MHILLLDWSKAFDSIRWEAMISALQRPGTPENYVRILSSLYHSPVFFVSDTFGRFLLHHVFQGVRQDDGLP